MNAIFDAKWIYRVYFSHQKEKLEQNRLHRVLKVAKPEEGNFNWRKGGNWVLAPRLRKMIISELNLMCSVAQDYKESSKLQI